jgi:hypothetical protein
MIEDCVRMWSCLPSTDDCFSLTELLSNIVTILPEEVLLAMHKSKHSHMLQALPRASVDTDPQEVCIAGSKLCCPPSRLSLLVCAVGQEAVPDADPLHPPRQAAAGFGPGVDLLAQTRLHGGCGAVRAIQEPAPAGIDGIGREGRARLG